MVHESQPQPCEVSMELLDVLCVEALQALELAALRRCIENGDVDGAVSIMKGVCPAILQDARYLFKLTKQKFVDHCSQGSDLAAIACARDQLAPLALDAYPEAYLEFKHSLQLLVYTKDVQRQQHESVRDTCSQEARDQLAAMVYHAAWQSLGLQEPSLYLIMTYLLHLHRVHRSAVPGGQLPEQELVDRLLLPLRDAAPLPCEGGHGGDSFREADVQALIQCAGSSRREATEALKHVRGDTQLAFQHELSRLRVDRQLFASLLAEYAAIRGLRVCVDDVDAAGPARMQLDGGEAAGWSCSQEEEGRGKASAQGQGLAAAEESCSSRPTSDEASWSIRQHLQSLHPDRSMSQSPPTKVARCHGLQESRLAGDGNLQTKLAQLAHLATDGQLDVILSLVDEVDSAFFDQHPELLFSLKRCKFLKLLQTGEASQALMYARSELAPIATKHEALQPLLKATTAMLLDMHQEEEPAAALQSATASLQAALRLHMGMHGPLLVKLLQALLGVHRAWQRHQKFNDPFQGPLKLEMLRQAASPGHISTEALVGAAAQHGLDSSVADLLSDEDVDDDMDEDAVLRLMEILEVPRATAFELLMHHGGDVEAAIMSSLG